MSGPFLGGFAITSMAWAGPQALHVRFTTTYGSDYQHQLYVNRILSGVTDTVLSRDLLANVIPSDWPQEIQLMAVDPADASTDFALLLPPRPYNQIKVTVTPAGWTDAAYIDLTGGTEPGGAVDDSNLLERVLFDTNRPYEIITPPLPGSGVWNLEATGVDATEPTGNRGTPQAVSVSIYAHPPDVLYRTDGSRFSVSEDSGNLVVEFTEAI